MKIKLDEADLRLALDVWVDMNFNGFELKDVTISEKNVSVTVERVEAIDETKVWGKEDLGTIQRGGKAVGE